MAVELDVNNLAMPASEPFVLLMNTEADGANIEAPMLWMWEYEISEEQQKQYNSSVLTTYHLAYNSGCYAHSGRRTVLLILIPLVLFFLPQIMLLSAIYPQSDLLSSRLPHQPHYLHPSATDRYQRLYLEPNPS